MQAYMMRQAGNQMLEGGKKMLPTFGRAQAANYRTNPLAGASSFGTPNFGSSLGPRGSQRQSPFQVCRAGPPELVHVGPGGNYKAQMGYEYVGQGAGEYDYVRKRPNTKWLGPVLCCLFLVPFFCLVYWLWTHHEWTTTTTALFDCDRGWENWHEEWGAQKQHYCCESVERGCVATTTIITTTPRFHCGWGFGQWETLWSDDKKAWCCQEMERGCADGELTTPPPWVCDEETNWDLNWPKAKQEWCCEVSGRGCPVPEHDCDAVFEGWKKDWSFEMRSWCCTHCEEKVCHAKRCIPYLPQQMPVPMRRSEVDQDFLSSGDDGGGAAAQEASEASPVQASPPPQAIRPPTQAHAASELAAPAQPATPP